MDKLHYEIFINATREKVWDTMLGDATYREWTKPFDAGSYFKGDWSEGSKMLFIGLGKDGEGDGGMVSRIKENRHPEFISIEHVGFLKNGVEDTTSDEVKKWTPSFENYTLIEQDSGTLVKIDLDAPDEYKAMFNEMWPKALEIVKELAEK